MIVTRRKILSATSPGRLKKRISTANLFKNVIRMTRCVLRKLVCILVILPLFSCHCSKHYSQLKNLDFEQEKPKIWRYCGDKIFIGCNRDKVRTEVRTYGVK